MPNPLDPIWLAHGITLDAYGVVRRTLALGPAERAVALLGGQFAAPATDAQVVGLLDTAEDLLDEQTVLFLWLAHGKRTVPPAAVTPSSAYTTLTQFLRSCGLA